MQLPPINSRASSLHIGRSKGNIRRSCTWWSNELNVLFGLNLYVILIGLFQTGIHRHCFIISFPYIWQIKHIISFLVAREGHSSTTIEYSNCALEIFPGNYAPQVHKFIWCAVIDRATVSLELLLSTW